LLQFANKYKEQINNDPDFREKFNELCEKMDVNPMISRKTIWSDLGIGDFYNELSVYD
jgi:ESCRT-II complex subunit VPS22